MHKHENNYAFIDLQNLHLGTKSAGWIVDFQKLFIYLRERHSVTKAYLFLGYLRSNSKLYKRLRSIGFTLIFKETVKLPNGGIKGNCDVDLTLHALITINEFYKCVLITGDGDFYTLIQYMVLKDKFLKLLIPNKSSYSILYKRNVLKPYITYLSDLRSKIEKKRPHEDGTS